MCFKNQIVCITVAASILGVAFFAPSARANVYATDIKLNDGLSGITNGSGTINLAKVGTGTPALEETPT